MLQDGPRRRAATVERALRARCASVVTRQENSAGMNGIAEHELSAVGESTHEIVVPEKSEATPLLTVPGGQLRPYLVLESGVVSPENAHRKKRTTVGSIAGGDITGRAEIVDRPVSICAQDERRFTDR